MDAVGWLPHLGGEGSLHVHQLWQGLALLNLDQVVLSLAAQRQAGEWHWLDGHLGLLGLAGWAALGNWDLGDAHLAWAHHGQVLEDCAAAGGGLVGLGNLGWLDHDLGADLGLLLELGDEVGWDRDGRGWDGPGGDLQLWLGEDALGSLGLGDDWLLEAAAQAGQLVLHLNGWDDLEPDSVGPDLVQVEPWGLDDDDTVGGLLKGGDDRLAGDVVSDDWLGGDLDWLAVDEDTKDGSGWDDLDNVLLQDDLGFPLAVAHGLGHDAEPVEVG